MLLDEYGSVAGMVTLENVLEELVGPIQDEFDRETPPIVPLGDEIYEVDASCPLDVVAETCHLEFPETDAETAGGLVLDLLGRLGKAGDAVTIDGHRLTILPRIQPGSEGFASSLLNHHSVHETNEDAADRPGPNSRV